MDQYFTLAGQYTMKQHNYTFEEFARHLKDYSLVPKYGHVEVEGKQMEVADYRVFQSLFLWVMDYMKQNYPDEEEANQKANLFFLIQMYLADHAHEFDQGGYAVLGGEKGLVSRRLLRAIHHLYTSRPSLVIGRGPSPKEVMELAYKYVNDD